MDKSPNIRLQTEFNAQYVDENSCVTLLYSLVCFACLSKACILILGECPNYDVGFFLLFLWPVYYSIGSFLMYFCPKHKSCVLKMRDSAF